MHFFLPFSRSVRFITRKQTVVLNELYGASLDDNMDDKMTDQSFIIYDDKLTV